MAGKPFFKAGGVWYETDYAYYKAGGTWRKASVFEKQNGVWVDVSPPPQIITESWNSIVGTNTTDTGSYNENYGWRTDTSRVYQGDWNGNGRHHGIWIFPSEMYNALNNAEKIDEMKVTVTRPSSGGYSTTVFTTRVHYHTMRPAGEPNIDKSSSNYDRVTISHGETVTFNLTPEQIGLFLNNGAKGVAVYTASTDNTDYGYLEPEATIEATYTPGS